MLILSGIQRCVYFYFVVIAAFCMCLSDFLHSLRLFKFKCWLFLRHKLLFERVSAFAMLVDGRGPGITIWIYVFVRMRTRFHSTATTTHHQWTAMRFFCFHSFVVVIRLRLLLLALFFLLLLARALINSSETAISSFTALLQEHYSLWLGDRSEQHAVVARAIRICALIESTEWICVCIFFDFVLRFFA